MIRNAPGTQRVSTLWKSLEYLQTHIERGDNRSELELHSFVGDEYKTGRPGNSRISLTTQGLKHWWKQWATDVTISSAAESNANISSASNHERRRYYLQVTSGERPFLNDDVGPLFGMLPTSDEEVNPRLSESARALFSPAAAAD